MVTFIRSDRSFRRRSQLVVVSVAPRRAVQHAVLWRRRLFHLAGRRVAMQRLGVSRIDRHGRVSRMFLARLDHTFLRLNRFTGFLHLWLLFRVRSVLVILLDLLPYPLQHQVTGDGIVEPLCKLLAVPDEQLLVGQDRFRRVKVNVHLVLAGDQILRLGRIGRIHVAHPVGLGRVVSVDVIKHFAVVVHLQVYDLDSNVTNNSVLETKTKRKRKTYPPKVFTIGVFWNVILGVNVADERTESRTAGDVIAAPHSQHIRQRLAGL